MAVTDPHIRTRTLARVAGPYFVVMALTLFAHADTLALLFPALMQDGPLVLVTGAFTVIVGLVIVAAHHHFTSPAAIVISLLGIAAALKGAMLMIAPEIGSGLTAAFVRVPVLSLLTAALLLLLGAWLTFVGWAPDRSGKPS